MKRLPATVLLFSIVFALFFMTPPFLGYTFGPYPLTTVADVVDLFTPVALIPMYWLVFRVFAGGHGATLKEEVAFVVLAAVWVLGHGIHLAANSISHLDANLKGTDIYNLVSFYDETLGHYLWHFGMVGLSALLIYRQWKSPFDTAGVLARRYIPAGLIYGFTYFAVIIEGGTAPLGLPFAVMAVIVSLVWGRQKFSQQPVLFFFMVAYLTAVALFAVWGIRQHGL